MPNIPPIQFKRSHNKGAKPTANQLAVGELALNFADQTIYTKDSDGNIISIGGGSGSGLLVLDSEKVLAQLAQSGDSDDIKHKESVVYLIEEKKLVSWDSDADQWYSIQLGSGQGDVYEDFVLTSTENPILSITNTDILQVVDSEEFIVLFESFPLPKNAYKFLNGTGAWQLQLYGGRDSETSYIGDTWAIGDKIRITTVYTVNSTEKTLGYSPVRELNPRIQKWTTDSDIQAVYYIDTLTNPWFYNNKQISGAVSGADLSDSDTNWYFFEDSCQPSLVAKSPHNVTNNGYAYYTGARVNSSRYTKQIRSTGFDMTKPGTYKFNLKAPSGPVYVLALGGGGSGARGINGGSGGQGGNLTITQMSQAIRNGDLVSVTIGAGATAPLDSDMNGYDGGNTTVVVYHQNGYVTTTGGGGKGGRSSSIWPDPNGEVRTIDDNSSSQGQIYLWGGNGGRGNPTTPANANGANGGEFTYLNKTWRSGAGGAGGLTTLTTTLNNVHKVTEPGNHTFDIPLNAFNVRVVAVGGGGSGGQGVGSGSGGGGGSIVGATLPSTYAGTTLSFSVGSGGKGIPSNSSQIRGNNGGSSYVYLQDGNSLIAFGGAGGYSGGGVNIPLSKLGVIVLKFSLSDRRWTYGSDRGRPIAYVWSTNWNVTSFNKVSETSWVYDPPSTDLDLVIGVGGHTAKIYCNPYFNYNPKTEQLSFQFAFSSYYGENGATNAYEAVSDVFITDSLGTVLYTDGGGSSSRENTAVTKSGTANINLALDELGAGGAGGESHATQTFENIQTGKGGDGGIGGFNGASSAGSNGQSITVGGISYQAGGGGGGGIWANVTTNTGGSAGGGIGGKTDFASQGDGAAGTGGGGGGGGTLIYRPGSGAGGSGYVSIIYDLYVSTTADVHGGSSRHFVPLLNAGGSPGSRISPTSWFDGGDGVDGTGSGGGGGGGQNGKAGAGGSGRAVILWSNYKVIDFDIYEFYKVPSSDAKNMFVKTEASGRINYEKMKTLSEMSNVFAASNYYLEPSKVFTGTPAQGAEMRYFVDGGVGTWDYDCYEVELANNTSQLINNDVEIGWSSTNGYYWKNVSGGTLWFTDRIVGTYYNSSNVSTKQAESTSTRSLSANTTMNIFSNLDVSKTNNNGVIMKLRTSISDTSEMDESKVYEINLVQSVVNTTRKIIVKRLK